MSVKSICGVILISKDPQALATFYQAVLAIPFEKEDHGGLAVHFGADIGEVHFGIHPPANFQQRQAGNASVSVAFNVDSLSESADTATSLGAKQIVAPHDEGFGLVASFEDPEGNLFELVELDYEFDS